MEAERNGSNGSNGGDREQMPWQDFVHTGPTTLAGRYMRMFWQPVRRSQDLQPGISLPIRIMDEEFTLYRGESGRAQVLAFRCAHQGTQLSTGWVEGDNIRCYFHGWVYDPSGQCIEQPGESRNPFCERIRIRSYPTQEYLGLIFAYLGDGPAPEMVRYPDFEREGLLFTNTYTRSCNYFQDLEPAPVHGAFVHSKGKPLGAKAVPVEVRAAESEWGVTTYAEYPNGKTKVKQFGMPNVHHVMSPPDRWGSGWSDSLVWKVPIDDTSMHSFQAELVHIAGEAAESYREQRDAWSSHARYCAPELAEAVLAGKMRIWDANPDEVNITWLEDEVAYLGQGPLWDRSQERLGASDCGTILLRRIWVRELRNLAEGQPLKTWERTDDLVATEGVRT